MLGVKLVIVGGGAEGDEFFPTLPAILGRAREATLPLPHPLVSRHHCELMEKNGQVFVRDLGSTNGTFVGSERVDSETVIEHGALLTIGTVTFRAFYEGQPVPEHGADAKDSVPVHQQYNHVEDAKSTDTSSITRLDTDRVELPKRRQHAKSVRKI